MSVSKMLTSDEFIQWCQKLELSEQTVKYIASVRESPPSRLVRSRKGNVSGRYPSKKMGSTIQFESTSCELAGIYSMEYDSQVLEYYDQPEAIKLLYTAKNGRNIGVLHTPDFFVLRGGSAGWEEWKTDEELKRLTVKMPHRYQQEVDNLWRCLPGENIAKSMGLYYVLRTSAEINWNLQRNLRFLEDYYRSDSLEVNDETREKIISIISCFQGITLEELLSCGIPADDIYTMIAQQELYVDLDKYPLVSSADKIQIWIEKRTADNYENVISPIKIASTDSTLISVGMIGIWDGKTWEIANIGLTTVALLSPDKKIVQLTLENFNEFLKNGDFLFTPSPYQNQAEANKILEGASELEIREANRRYQIIFPCLQGETVKNINFTRRTVYYWLKKWRDAESKYGFGYIGLLPNYKNRGNRGSKLTQATQKMIDDFISSDYESLKQKGKFAAYSGLYEACLLSGLTPPSYKTFVSQINQRSNYEQVEKRQGKRNAYKHEPFYWELELTTPRHGDRPFEICHIDHTELDIELISSRTKVNLGRPWATFLSDAYSRRILGIYLTFDPPSYRSCMMVMKECVHRHGRLPNTVVVDGGKEFHSVYFERLLAAYLCTKKTRPPAKPRFGSVCERLFGSANTNFIHNLQGNTQITRQARGVTKNINPRNLAVWTLSSLYQNLCDWAYEFYDNKKHPALGQSPKEAFNEAVLQTGLRSHKIIPYDETFRIFTLPTTSKGTAKIIPNLGIKINYIYYWHSSFQNAELETTQVPVRYDPYDVGVAYAYVKTRWVTCISQHYSTFGGRSEKEIMLASVELRKQHKNHSKQFVVTASSLAKLLSQAEQQELILLQRMRDMEAKDILSVIDSESVQESQLNSEKILAFPVTTSDLEKPQILDEPEEIKPYEEFW
jgi:putative transposase